MKKTPTIQELFEREWGARIKRQQKARQEFYAAMWKDGHESGNLTAGRHGKDGRMRKAFPFVR